MQVWDLSSNSAFHAQIWKFKNSASISETAASRHIEERVYATSRTVLPYLFYAKTDMQILNLPANSVS